MYGCISMRAIDKFDHLAPSLGSLLLFFTAGLISSNRCSIETVRPFFMRYFLVLNLRTEFVLRLKEFLPRRAGRSGTVFSERV